MGLGRISASACLTFFVKEVEGQAMDQGCQMVCFQTKNPNLGKFCRVLQLKMSVYFMEIWSIIRSFSIIYLYSVYFVVIWYIFSRFGILFQEKSGNPAMDPSPRKSKVDFSNEKGEEMPTFIFRIHLEHFSISERAG
jgi:hypothetical protein